MNITGLSHPHVGCSINAKTVPARPIVQSSAPTTSTDVFSRGASTLSFVMSKSVTIIGMTLIMNTHCHEKLSTRNPPTSGPMINDMPVQAVQLPMAFPCALPLKDEIINASELGTSSAPKTPWSARAAISCSIVSDAAQNSDVIPKPMTPHERIRLRPNISESEPATSISAPSVSI